MKVTVTLAGPSAGSSTPSFRGQHLIASSWGVWLDGDQVIERDRRMKSNRIPGHPWMLSDRKNSLAWVTFKVDLNPDA